jgi:hypothetical protein
MFKFLCNWHVLDSDILNWFKNVYMRAVQKVRGLAAVRRYYSEEGGDCYAKL